MPKTPSRHTSCSRLFSIVDYFSTWPRMPPQADRSSIDSIGSLPAWMLNPLINMISMLPGGGEQLPVRSATDRTPEQHGGVRGGYWPRGRGRAAEGNQPVW